MSILDAVTKAMKATLPEHFTPEKAAEIANTITARLGQDEPSSPPVSERCPDGVAWCVGKPATHDGTDETYHESTEYALRGTYLHDGQDGAQCAGFNLAQWEDRTPRLVFQGVGFYPDLDLSQVDELCKDMVEHTVNLLAARRLYADALNPSPSGPIREPEDSQTSSAAFSLAHEALAIALEKGPDRAGTLAAIRSLVGLLGEEFGG